MPITPLTEYKQHAGGCRLLAFLTTNAKHKTTLEGLAQSWEKLAKAHERDLVPEQES